MNSPIGSPSADLPEAQGDGSSRLSRMAMAVIWPSFLMAGVVEALVFAVVDPSDLTWFGGAPMDLPRQAIYTLSFLLFWLVIGLSSSLSLLLADLPNQPENPHPRAWPR
ncbi:hypothetical protein WG899_06975 [Paucibacter sp. AS339]|uniref:hypothetical protein n=1 Tax=Paucibacter hankyongi TaxID=3133434 RepID=UPI00309754E1